MWGRGVSRGLKVGRYFISSTSLAAQTAEYIGQARLLVPNINDAETLAKVALALAVREKEKEKEMALLEKEKEKEMALLEKEKEKEMALLEKDQALKDMERDALKKVDESLVLYRYQYLHLTARFLLERLFSDFVSYAEENDPSLKFELRDDKMHVINTKVNNYLLKNDTTWQDFVAHEGLNTTMRKHFPGIPGHDGVLYPILSDQIHKPPELCMLDFDGDLQPTPYWILLRDVAKHYSKRGKMSVTFIKLKAVLSATFVSEESGQPTTSLDE